MDIWKTIWILCVCVGLSVATAEDLNDLRRTQFAEFRTRFGRRYADDVEEARSFRIFSENLKAMEGEPTFGVNEFSDWTADEFRNRFLGPARAALREKGHHPFNMSRRSVWQHSGPSLGRPLNFDWRDHAGIVTPVMYQGENCVAGWAFALVGSFESSRALAGMGLERLSAQSLLDCASVIGTTCNDPEDIELFGLVLLIDGSDFSGSGSGGCWPVKDECLPYTGVPEKCTTYSPPSCCVENAADLGWNDGDEDDLADMVWKYGPVAVYFCGAWLQHYSSGIFDGTCACDIENWCEDDAVGGLIVGFGTSGGTDYWIVKQNFGANWGEGGYFRIRRGGQGPVPYGSGSEVIFPGKCCLNVDTCIILAVETP